MEANLIEQELENLLFEVNDVLYGPGRRRLSSGEHEATLMLAKANILATLYKIETGE
jgi:hypothetical protein